MDGEFVLPKFRPKITNDPPGSASERHTDRQRSDFAVANQPLSYKAWTNGLNTVNDPYKRFEMGIPPSSNGDYAFLLHLISSLKADGKGAIILPHEGCFEAIRKRSSGAT